LNAELDVTIFQNLLAQDHIPNLDAMNNYNCGTISLLNFAGFTTVGMTPVTVFIFYLLSDNVSANIAQNLDNSCIAKANNNATAVNDFANMHCLAKANHHMFYAMNDFPGVACTDVAK
jgi:hypothetical protein